MTTPHVIHISVGLGQADPVVNSVPIQ